MLQPFYYGCEDPLDWDPSLEGILLRDSSHENQDAAVDEDGRGVLL